MVANDDSLLNLKIIKEESSLVFKKRESGNLSSITGVNAPSQTYQQGVSLKKLDPAIKTQVKLHWIVR